jgi:hypothetical protein
MTGCSTFSDQLAETYRRKGWEPTRRTVEVTTLGALCAEHAADRTIDFVKIDVEGGEGGVLAGADFERFRPRVLVVESTVPGTTIPSYETWEPGVLEAHYEFVLFDGLNRFYVREEDQDLVDLLSSPANVLDDYIQYRCSTWRERANELDAARSEAQAARTALERTRETLARSEAALRDARTELGATREALTLALRKAT